MVFDKRGTKRKEERTTRHSIKQLLRSLVRPPNSILHCLLVIVKARSKMHVKPISENVECVYESTNYIDLEINLYLSINLLYRSINLCLYMCVQYLKKGGFVCLFSDKSL